MREAKSGAPLPHTRVRAPATYVAGHDDYAEQPPRAFDFDFITLSRQRRLLMPPPPLFCYAAAASIFFVTPSISRRAAFIMRCYAISPLSRHRSPADDITPPAYTQRYDAAARCHRRC